MTKGIKVLVGVVLMASCLLCLASTPMADDKLSPLASLDGRYGCFQARGVPGFNGQLPPKWVPGAGAQLPHRPGHLR